MACRTADDNVFRQRICMSIAAIAIRAITGVWHSFWHDIVSVFERGFGQGASENQHNSSPTSNLSHGASPLFSRPPMSSHLYHARITCLTILGAMPGEFEKAVFSSDRASAVTDALRVGAPNLLQMVLLSLKYEEEKGHQALGGAGMRFPHLHRSGSAPSALAHARSSASTSSMSSPSRSISWNARAFNNISLQALKKSSLEALRLWVTSPVLSSPSTSTTATLRNMIQSRMELLPLIFDAMKTPKLSSEAGETLLALFTCRSLDLSSFSSSANSFQSYGYPSSTSFSADGSLNAGHGLGGGNSSNAANSAFSSCFTTASKMAQTSVQQEDPNFISEIISQLLSLVDSYRDAVLPLQLEKEQGASIASNGGAGYEDWDESIGMCRAIVLLFVGFGEANVSLISTSLNVPLVRDFLEVLLEMTQNPILDIAELGMQFWNALEYNLCGNTEFVPLFSQLLKNTLQTCEFPIASVDDTQALLGNESDDEEMYHWRILRESAVQTLRACYAVIGDQFLDSLQEIINRGSNTTQQSQDSKMISSTSSLQNSQGFHADRTHQNDSSQQQTMLSFNYDEPQWRGLELVFYAASTVNLHVPRDAHFISNLFQIAFSLPIDLFQQTSTNTAKSKLRGDHWGHLEGGTHGLFSNVNSSVNTATNPSLASSPTSNLGSALSTQGSPRTSIWGQGSERTISLHDRHLPPLLLITIVRFIGEYRHWIMQQDEPLRILEPALLATLQWSTAPNSEFSFSSAIAFKELCLSSGTHLTPHLFSICEKYASYYAHARAEDRVVLSTGLVFLLRKLESNDEMVGALQYIWDPTITQIKFLLESFATIAQNERAGDSNSLNSAPGAPSNHSQSISSSSASSNSAIHNTSSRDGLGSLMGVLANLNSASKKANFAASRLACTELLCAELDVLSTCFSFDVAGTGLVLNGLGSEGGAGTRSSSPPLGYAASPSYYYGSLSSASGGQSGHPLVNALKERDYAVWTLLDQIGCGSWWPHNHAEDLESLEHTHRSHNGHANGQGLENGDGAQIFARSPPAPVVDRLCVLYSNLMRSCQEAYEPLLQTTLERLLNLFLKTNNSSALEALSTATKLFGTHHEYLFSFSRMMLEVSQAVYRAGNARNAEQLLCDYFGLCSTVLGTNPDILVANSGSAAADEVLNSLIQVCLQTLTSSDDTEMIFASLTVLDKLLFGRHVMERDAWKSFAAMTVDHMGEEIMESLLKCGVNATHRKAVLILCTVLHKLIQTHASFANVTLEKLFARDALPGNLSATNDDERARIIHIFLNLRSSIQFRQFFSDFIDVANQRAELDVFNAYEQAIINPNPATINGGNAGGNNSVQNAIPSSPLLHNLSPTLSARSSNPKRNSSHFLRSEQHQQQYLDGSGSSSGDSSGSSGNSSLSTILGHHPHSSGFAHMNTGRPSLNSEHTLHNHPVFVGAQHSDAFSQPSLAIESIAHVHSTPHII